MRSVRGMYPFISFYRGISCSAVQREHAVNKEVFVYWNNKFCYSPVEAKLTPDLFLNLYDIQKRQLATFIPYFIAGSILKVVWTDKTSVSGLCQFTGICINKKLGKTKVSSTFTLRNVVNKEGVSLTFELYSPIMQSVELIRFQRLVFGKTNLNDLEDCPLSASTIPHDLERVYTDKPLILTCWQTRPYLSDAEVKQQVKEDKLNVLDSPEEVKLLYDPYYKWLKTRSSSEKPPEETFFDVNKPTEQDFDRTKGMKVKLDRATAEA